MSEVAEVCPVEKFARGIVVARRMETYLTLDWTARKSGGSS
jgi:hypothetical protein